MFVVHLAATMAVLVFMAVFSFLLPPTSHSSIIKALSSTAKPVRLPEAKVVDGRMFPLTLVPTQCGADRLAFVRSHGSQILELVRTHGAVLLRGWGAGCPQHFSEIASSLGLAASEMACSAGPRLVVANNVFTANEAPPSERIPFHHEMAQCDAPPSVVAFYCIVPASTGGATPIIQSHLAASYLRTQHAAVAERLAKRGIRYVRVMPPVTDPGSALGKSWKNSLRVETAAEAEAALTGFGSTWAWLPGGMLRTVTKPMAALLVEERTGREVFFTAAETTFNAVEDDAKNVTDALEGSADGTDGADEATSDGETIRPSKSFIFGDGAPLDAETKHALLDVMRFMNEAQVAVPWQAGDALLLDNATVQHARETFEGPRRILASLVGKLAKTDDGVLREGSGKDVAKPSACPMLDLGNASPSSSMDDLNVHRRRAAMPSTIHL